MFRLIFRCLFRHAFNDIQAYCRRYLWPPKQRVEVKRSVLCFRLRWETLNAWNAAAYNSVNAGDMASAFNNSTSHVNLAQIVFWVSLTQLLSIPLPIKDRSRSFPKRFPPLSRKTRRSFSCEFNLPSGEQRTHFRFDKSRLSRPGNYSHGTIVNSNLLLQIRIEWAECVNLFADFDNETETEVRFTKSADKKAKERSETLLWNWKEISTRSLIVSDCSLLLIVIYAMCYISPRTYEIKAETVELC